MLVFNMTQLQPVSYNHYQYPSYAIVIGWVIGMVTVAPIPLYMIKAIACAEGSLQQVITYKNKLLEVVVKTSYQYNEKYIDRI